MLLLAASSPGAFAQTTNPTSSPAATGAALSLSTMPGAVPADITELRLQALENKAGVHSYVWAIQIPAGKKMVINLDYKMKGQQGSLVFNVTGPIEAKFANRIYLLQEFTPIPGNLGRYEELTLEVTAGQSTGVISERRAIGQAVIPSASGWGGGTGIFSSSNISDWTTLYHENGGFASNPKEVEYTLRAKLAPSAPGDKVGQVELGKL